VNKPVNLYYFYSCLNICFFYFFIFFLYFFYLFFIFFVGLGPAQPTWAGLSPAGPAGSLAQASDPAGLHEARVIQITRAWLLLINSNRQRKWEQRRKGKKKQSVLTWFCREFVRGCRRWHFCFRTASYSLCLYLALYFVSRFRLLSSEGLFKCSVFLSFLCSLPVCFCFLLF
jgi:hypothetical protein